MGYDNCVHRRYGLNDTILLWTTSTVSAGSGHSDGLDYNARGNGNGSSNGNSNGSVVAATAANVASVM